MSGKRYFSFCQYFHHIPAAFCLHQDQRISPSISENWEPYQIQWRLEVTSMHAGNRCRQLMTSSKTRWTRKIQRKAFLFGYSFSQLIKRTWRRMCSHIPQRANSDSEGDTSNGQKAEAQCACLLPQPNRDLFWSQKSMLTWQQESTKSSTKDVNLGTITDTLSWCKFSHLSGIRVKPRLHMRRTRIYESSCSRGRSHKLFIRTVRVWEVLWRLLWNNRITTFHRRRGKRNCRTSFKFKQKKGHKPYYGNLDRVILYGMPLLYAKMYKISWHLGKLHTKGVLENHLKDHLCHLVQWWSISQIPRDNTRIHQFGKKILPGFLIGILCSREIWEEGFLIAEIEELEKLDASETYRRRLNAKEVLTTQKDGESVFPVAVHQNSGRDYEFQEPTESGIHRKERESQRRISWLSWTRLFREEMYDAGEG